MLTGKTNTSFERIYALGGFKMKTITKLAVGVVLFSSAFAVYAATGCCPCC